MDQTSNANIALLSDAMDKVCEHCDTCPTGPLNVPDAMDTILESTQSHQNPVLQVEMAMPIPEVKKLTTLPVETKPCSVSLTRLESILGDDLLKVPPTAASDLPVGEHFTRSRSTPITHCTGRKPHIASTGIKYNETQTEVEPPVPIKPKSSAAKPNRTGPTQNRIDSRSNSSVAPSVQLPPIKTEPAEEFSENDNTSAEDSTDQSDSQEDDIPLAEVARKLCGTFKTKQHTLVKIVNVRKYRCRMCNEQLPSCKALTAHHQSKHSIIYCDVCRKAFNNPRLLTKHMYQHKEKTQICNKCGEKFPFASQLATHKLTHRTKPNQVCMYPKCGRRFKSKSDLNRHAALYTMPWLKCPDCQNYKTKDKHNFESHRLSHSKIKKYFCEKCSEGFTFNTQKLRHVANKKC